MEIYLIRHTAPKIEKGICYGQTNLDLRETFQDELSTVKSKLIDLDDNFIVYSSPLKRCKFLADELSIQSTIIDNRLMELNFGDWEMKEWSSINRSQLDTWMNDFVNEPCPNGESYIQLHKRVSDFLEEVKVKKLPKVIIVTHAGVIRSIHSYINSIQLKNSFDLKVQYGEVLKYKL